MAHCRRPPAIRRGWSTVVTVTCSCPCLHDGRLSAADHLQYWHGRRHRHRSRDRRAQPQIVECICRRMIHSVLCAVVCVGYGWLGVGRTVRPMRGGPYIQRTSRRGEALLRNRDSARNLAHRRANGDRDTAPLHCKENVEPLTTNEISYTATDAQWHLLGIAPLGGERPNGHSLLYCSTNNPDAVSLVQPAAPPCPHSPFTLPLPHPRRTPPLYCKPPLFVILSLFQCGPHQP